MPGRRSTRKAVRSDPLVTLCRTLPGATEDIKWEDDHVFSVGRKMFACFSLTRPGHVSFKCSDDDYDRLTEIDGIIPAPYAARFGWVLVERRRALSAGELRRLIRDAHRLVFERLPARVRAEIGSQSGAET